MTLIYILTSFLAGLAIGVFVAPQFRRGGTAARDERGDKDENEPLLERQAKEKEENLTRIRTLLAEKGRLTNDEVERLLGVSDATAERYLDELEKNGVVRQVGATGKHTYYEKI